MANQHEIEDSDHNAVVRYLFPMTKDQIKRLGRDLGLSEGNLDKMDPLLDKMVAAWLRKEEDVIKKCGNILTWETLAKKLTEMAPPQTNIAQKILVERCGQRSISIEPLLPTGTGASKQARAGAQLAIPDSMSHMKKENESRIQDCFIRLTNSIEAHFMKKKPLQVSANDIRKYLELKLCQCTNDNERTQKYANKDLSFSDCNTVSDLFTNLFKKRIWDFYNYILAKSLIENFDRDNSDLWKSLCDYEQELNGFLVATKMIEAIPECKCIPGAFCHHGKYSFYTFPQRNPKLFSTFSGKFPDINIQEESMKYVDELCNSITTRLRLPREFLLYEKAAQGCAIITWCFPNILRTYILSVIRENFTKLKELGISEIWIGDKKYTVPEQPHPTPAPGGAYSAEGPDPGKPKHTMDDLCSEPVVPIRKCTGLLPEQLREKVELILHTCNDKENKAVLKSLTAPTVDGCAIAAKVVYDGEGFAKIGMFGDKLVAVLFTGQGNLAQGNLQTALEKYTNATQIVGVGVGYGNPHKEEINLADVMVSDVIVNGSLTVKGDVYTFSNTVPVNDELLQHARNLQSDWNNTFTVASNPDRKSKVHLGSIVSTDTLVKAAASRDKYMKTNRKAIGGEMEGWVLLSVLDEMRRKNRIIGIIVIKGVGGYGDKDEDKVWQPTAAMAAVSFVHYVLEYCGPL